MGQIIDRVDDKREQEKSKRSIFDKIKRIKHLDILIACLVLVVVLCVYFGVFNTKKHDVITTSEQNRQFLNQLESVLSSIDGVGKVKMMINYNDNKVVEIASREETTTRVEADGTTSVIETSREPIIVRNDGKDKPIVLRESGGEIKGVIIVCKGGGDMKIKLNLMDAISTLLNISPDQVKIYEMK